MPFVMYACGVQSYIESVTVPAVGLFCIRILHGVILSPKLAQMKGIPRWLIWDRT